MGYGRYYGIVTNQNKRPYQEDRFTVVPRFYDDGGDFFGIFDGHGGDKTATELQRNFHEFFHKGMSFQKRRYGSHAVYFDEQEILQGKINPLRALKFAFSQEEKVAVYDFTDGSTALAVYIDAKNQLYCAWVGDTRAVLESNGVVGFATRDHKPNDPLELRRIKAHGGSIYKHGVWRIGGLALSRSIGDRDIKKHYPQVIAKPDLELIQLTENNHFLIMASDGLWDVVSSEEAVKIVHKQLAEKGKKIAGTGGVLEHSKDLDSIAHLLQNVAMERGSGDNITICIVQFDWTKEEPSPTLMTRLWNWLRGKR